MDKNTTSIRLIVNLHPMVTSAQLTEIAYFVPKDAAKTCNQNPTKNKKKTCVVSASEEVTEISVNFECYHVSMVCFIKNVA